MVYLKLRSEIKADLVEEARVLNLQNIEKQMVPGKITAEEVSFECHVLEFSPQTQKLELHHTRLFE